MSKISKAAYNSFLFLLIYDSVFWLWSGGYGGNSAGRSIDLFVPLLYLSIYCLLTLFVKTRWEQEISRYSYRLYCLILWVNAICYLRGAIDARSYYTWKEILASPLQGLSLFIPMAMVVGLNYNYCVRIFETSIKFLKYAIILIPFQLTGVFVDEGYSHTVFAVIFLAMLMPIFKRQEVYVVMCTLAASVVCALSWRANALRIGIAIGILAYYYFRKTLNAKSLWRIQLFVFATPLYLFYLGVTSDYDVFASKSETSVVVNGEEQDLSEDTRTFLYSEVLADLYKTNTLIFGKGITGKYKSEFFKDVNSKDSRGGTEVGFLNILLRTGIVGAVLYFLLIVRAVYSATMYSNSTYCKMFALFLTTHWVLTFVENFPGYNTYYYFTYIITGLCLSKSFRDLTDEQITYIFTKNMYSLR